MNTRPTTIALISTLTLCCVACTADPEETAPPPPEQGVHAPQQPDLPEGGDDEETTEETPSGPSGGLCGALLDLAGSDQPVSECEEALAADCERVVGTLSDPYVDAVERCVADGGDILGCMVDSVDAFQKTEAHEELAAAFCDECAFGAPGCEQLFYVADSEWGLGTVLLPFSAEVLDDVRAECADGFTCAIDFPSCAMDVVKERLDVDASRECLMDEVL